MSEDFENDDTEDTEDIENDKAASSSGLQDKYSFDATTLLIGLQILPGVEGSRQVLVTAGIKGEPPIITSTVLAEIAQSSVLAEALEQLKQLLPQRAKEAATKEAALIASTKTKTKVPIPDLPVPHNTTEPSQLTLFT
ncbi:hypothetical protein [Synechocystis sp. PCC 7509]|uniref:hypothetical protein n=1 Tax=Synechocystis sp. PCC 7509 TaxID=927677 RepID=UPI0002AC652C|nr:hypothetical protein [Synechocystis sp. PCC 7509]